MLARGWLAYPVTSIHSPIYRRRAVVYVNTSIGLHSLVAERRHSSVTRYAKRSVACRDSPRHQTLRAGGTPLPRHRRLPHPIVRHHHRIAPPGAVYHKKTAEERFHTLARGWLAYPVTSMHSHLPPKSGCRSHIPRLANPMTPTQTQSPCKQLLQPLFGGRFLIQQLTPGRQANLGLRLYNRPSAVAYIIGLRIVIEKITPPGAVYHKKNRRRAV